MRGARCLVLAGPGRGRLRRLPLAAGRGGPPRPHEAPARPGGRGGVDEDGPGGRRRRGGPGPLLRRVSPGAPPAGGHRRGGARPRSSEPGPRRARLTFQTFAQVLGEGAAVRGEVSPPVFAGPAGGRTSTDRMRRRPTLATLSVQP